jgi:hypothetical protein
LESDRISTDIGGMTRERRELIAATFRAAGEIYGSMGSPLYRVLGARCAEDPEILELASHGIEGGLPVHLFASVHYLLRRNPDDPLSGYFATLNNPPLPPEQVYPNFARYCREHRDEIRELLATRMVQTTFVVRCGALMAMMSRVAEEAGGPLNLVELGCSAGILLTFDKYAYAPKGRGRIGPADAPLTVEFELQGGALPRIAEVGKRVGIDLNPIDVRSEDERRWILSLCFPELLGEAAQLVTAMDVVAATDISFIRGDGLALLPDVLAEMPDPLCIYHSAALYLWSPEARAALEALLIEASHGRDIYRVSIEPSEMLDSQLFGRYDEEDAAQRTQTDAVEATISLYRRGAVEHRPVAFATSDYSIVRWID